MLTRAAVDTILIRRAGRWLVAAQLDGTTTDGTNADLADPVATALRDLGYAVADVSAPVDADLALVLVADESKLLDVAELRVLESVAQNYVGVDAEADGAKVAKSDLAKRLDAAIARKRSQIGTDHGLYTARTILSTGTISLGFQEQLSCE